MISLLTASLLLQDAQSYADDNGLLFMETSAKTAMNVNEIFLAIGKFSNYLLKFLVLYYCYENSIAIFPRIKVQYTTSGTK